MLETSRAYKQQMEQPLRNHSYCIVTIGAINQQAQRNASVSGDTAYISNNTQVFLGELPTLLYGTLESDWTKCDGSMAFPPRQNTVSYLYNQGVVSEDILGSITFVFPVAYDIKGLTIQFAENYPVDFEITNDSSTYTYTGNAAADFVSGDVFNGTTHITITPSTMSNGNGRLRIFSISFGVGIQFNNAKLLSVVKRENVSPITDALPTIDLSVDVENYDNVWNVNNSSSSINYLEIGQKVTVSYGYEMDFGEIYWMDGAKCDLVSWRANEHSMSFEAQDKLASLTDIYYGGKPYENGISLYSLALLVLNDAGIEDDMYDLDAMYLRDYIVYNPLPAVSHAECLQIIANAGRCKLYTDRDGRICIYPSLETVIDVNRITVSSGNATEYSDVQSVIRQDIEKTTYGTLEENFTTADSSMLFLPRGTSYLPAGYVSEAVSDSEGKFTSYAYSKRPSIRVEFEAAFSFHTMTLNFVGNPPGELQMSFYLNGQPVGGSTYGSSPPFVEGNNVIEYDFPRMDTIYIYFQNMSRAEQSRVHLNSIAFGEPTDFRFTKRNMTSVPTGERSGKVKELQVIKTIYKKGTELQNIASETVDVTGLGMYTFYLSAPAHDFSATIDGSTALTVYDASAYFVTVDVSLYSGSHEIQINGYSYVTTESPYTFSINSTGTTEKWSNPLISENYMASLLAEWVGNYLKNNATYQITYRGEPRLDAGDFAYLEDEYIENMMIQITSHELSFNGALSGSVDARLALALNDD